MPVDTVGWILTGLVLLALLSISRIIDRVAFRGVSPRQTRLGRIVGAVGGAIGGGIGGVVGTLTQDHNSLFGLPWVAAVLVISGVTALFVAVAVLVVLRSVWRPEAK